MELFSKRTKGKPLMLGVPFHSETTGQAHVRSAQASSEVRKTGMGHASKGRLLRASCSRSSQGSKSNQGAPSTGICDAKHPRFYWGMSEFQSGQRERESQTSNAMILEGTTRQSQQMHIGNEHWRSEALNSIRAPSHQPSAIGLGIPAHKVAQKTRTNSSKPNQFSAD